MLLQSGPIAPSSLGLWAVTFILGGLVTWAVWLTLRHFNYAVPAYKRIFGNEDDPTDDGHLAHSSDRFDELSESQADLTQEVESIHDDVRKFERRQELVLSNQNAIASELGVDLERPRFYRGGRGEVDPGDRDRDEGPTPGDD